MIDREVFAQVWGRLCRRFNREPDAAELQDYLEYLDASGLTTEAFVAAAEAAWATREFFPRPADFLGAESGTGWRALLKMAKEVHRAPDLEAWKLLRATVPDRSWEAISALGGLDVIRQTKDLVFLRREYLNAYEAQVQAEAMGLERPPIEQPTPAYLRTSGGKLQRVLAALPSGTDA